jgi:tetratricopeptide (TPR) repeat protein
MKKILFLLVLTFFIFANSLFENGNDAYKEGNYEKALEYYLQLEKNQMVSASLYFNIGNCHYKLNAVGQAIRYYEKAQNLDPFAQDIKENLKIANSKIIDRIELPDQLFIFDLYQLLKYSLTLNTFLIVVFIGFFLFVFARFLKRFFSVSEGITLGTQYFASTIFILFLILSYQRISDLDAKSGIILEKNAVVYTSPNEENEAFILHEGTKCKILRDESGKYEISLLDGKTGWVEKSDIGEI